MASSAFSFHCMICFEEFDPINNFPVVLPCGHTYVCNNCANRLDKCMECRTPLEMKVEVPPPPPGQSSTPEAYHKENQPQHERMSPALLRRQQLVQNRYGRHPPNLTPKPAPPQSIKQRLPLPKNAVLLSLIQASEPARRRTNVHSPPNVPPEINRESSTENFQVSPAPPATPPSKKKLLLPKFSKTSALFVDTGLTAPSSSSECQNDDDDNEEHQIRVGTYLEGGPCGTYAVAVKTGLLVYPTLFEHALPKNNNSKMVSSSTSQRIDDQDDKWKRDVDELVKSSYRKKQQLQMKQECEDKKLPSRTQSSLFSHSHFEGRAGDEWEVEASIDDEVKSCHIGMRLSASLSISENRENRDDDLPAPSNSFSPNDDSNLHRTVPLTNTMEFTRQLSVPITPQRHKADSCDDFDRPLIRLKYGDRVQVVSMGSRGWVKLARGYGYIRLQNDKQLVKVGGTSDRACQIEATLHELSIERDRLKNEQTKLERLSAGLMIDLQSTLLTSDDHVICSAPEGIPRVDSDLDLMARSDKNLSLDDISTHADIGTHANKPSLDDISVNSRSPKPMHDSPTSAAQDIRVSKSHSPSQVMRMRGMNPPSPPPVDPRLSTPTRVNFRTGMSGHRALLSSNSNTHPHDFIGTPGSVRSMSNHSGISRGKKTRPRASIY